MRLNHELYQSYINELKDDLILNSNATYENYDKIAISREIQKRIKYWNDKIDELYKVKDYITINRGFM